MKLSIVIPCYNEVDNVDKLSQEFFPVLENLVKSGTAGVGMVEVIFVDDGSSDGTYNALVARFAQQDTPAITIRFEQHSVNRGLGAALRTGFVAASGDVIITTDSDGTYRFDEIPALLAKLSPDVDIVTASPYHPDGGVDNVPGYRLVLSRGSSLLYRVLVDYHVHTYTALFRAYRRDVVKTILFESNGFLGGTELMVMAMLNGYRVAEYPTVLHSRVFGASKAKIARTIKAHLRFQGKVALMRLGVQSAPGPIQPVGGSK